MATGIIRYFDPKNSTGFIDQDNGEGDLFFSVSRILGLQRRTFSCGDIVEYLASLGTFNPRALAVRVIRSSGD